MFVAMAAVTSFLCGFWICLVIPIPTKIDFINFRSLFGSGFRQGIHNVVVGHEDKVVVTGVLNATDIYSAFLGVNHEMSDCADIVSRQELQSGIMVTTDLVTASRMVLS